MFVSLCLVSRVCRHQVPAPPWHQFFDVLLWSCLWLFGPHPWLPPWYLLRVLLSLVPPPHMCLTVCSLSLPYLRQRVLITQSRYYSVSLSVSLLCLPYVSDPLILLIISCRFPGWNSRVRLLFPLGIMFSYNTTGMSAARKHGLLDFLFLKHNKKKRNEQRNKKKMIYRCRLQHRLSTCLVSRGPSTF